MANIENKMISRENWATKALKFEDEENRNSSGFRMNSFGASMNETHYILDTYTESGSGRGYFEKDDPPLFREVD